MTGEVNEEVQANKSKGERAQDEYSSSTNTNDGKLVQDISAAYRPSAAELAWAQLDQARIELKVPPAEDICTAENPSGISNKEIPKLEQWDGVLRWTEPIENQSSGSIAKVMAPVAATVEVLGTELLEDIAKPFVLIYKIGVRTGEYWREIDEQDKRKH